MENSEFQRIDKQAIEELIEQLKKRQNPRPVAVPLMKAEAPEEPSAESVSEEHDVNPTDDIGDSAESESSAAEFEAPATEKIQNVAEDKLHAVPSQYQRDILIERIVLKKRYRRTLTATVTVMLLIAAVAVFIAIVLCPVIKISGSGMEPAYQNGDIVVLLNSNDYEAGELICISYQNKLIVKRVIARSGDVVSIDENGNVSVNGSQLNEPYAINKCLGECDIEFPFRVPDGTFFVMGDRRDTSVDSRSTLVGCVGEKDILGKVIIKVWPLNSNQ